MNFNAMFSHFFLMRDVWEASVTVSNDLVRMQFSRLIISLFHGLVDIV